jgi:glutaryl-CoA dehydrogenase
MCGSEEQKARWLPDMAQMDKLGAFALTEPNHGSDSVALETSARPDGDSWVLTGRKRWIGLGSVADLVVVWARNTEDGQVNGFVVEKGSPGYQARVIEGKVSLRSVWQAEITLDNVRVPAENRLPGARSFKDTTRVLATTRSTCAWRRWATPPRLTTPPCGTPRSGTSSASRWPASRSSSSGWYRCWRT